MLYHRPETPIYNVIIDLFPLLDSLPRHEGRVLAEHIRTAALDALLDERHLDIHARALRLLLRLAFDLGYIEEDVHRFLQRKLAAFARA